MTNNGSDGGFGSDDDLEHTFSAQGVCVCASSFIIIQNKIWKRLLIAVSNFIADMVNVESFSKAMIITKMSATKTVLSCMVGAFMTKLIIWQTTTK